MEDVIAVGFCTHPVNLGSRADCAQTSCRIELVVVLCTATFFVTISNTTLGIACTVEGCNLINSLARNGKRNGVGVGKVLSEWLGIGISLLCEVAAKSCIQQVANLTTVQRIGCCVSGMLALEIACAVESVVAVCNRTVCTAEELVVAVEDANLSNVQTVPHSGITTCGLVPTAESRTSVDCRNRACIHAVLHVEVGILFATSTNHAGSTRGRSKGCIADTVENLEAIACTSIGLDKANDRAYTILARNGASRVHDDVLDLGITADKAKEAKSLVVRAVNYQIADGVELSVELAGVLIGVDDSAAFVCVTTNRTVVDACQVDVCRQNCLSIKLSIFFRVINTCYRVYILCKPFKFRGCTNLIHTIYLCGLVPSLVGARVGSRHCDCCQSPG